MAAMVTRLHMTAQGRGAALLNSPERPVLDARQRGAAGFDQGGPLLTDNVRHFQNGSGHGPGLQDWAGRGSASNGLAVAASEAFETCR
jgi:hypothetical protein